MLLGKVRANAAQLSARRKATRQSDHGKAILYKAGFLPDRRFVMSDFANISASTARERIPSEPGFV